MKDYYAVLGIRYGASAKEIKDAYRAMILQYHPDVYQGDPQEGTRITQQLNEAFEILGDEQKRTEHVNSQGVFAFYDNSSNSIGVIYEQNGG